MPKEPAKPGPRVAAVERDDRSPFDRFEELARKLVAVPKHVVDEARTNGKQD